MTSPELRYVIGADDTASRVLGKVRSSLDGLKASGSRLGNVLGSLGATLTAGAAAAFVRGINDGVDALNDMKDATGASIENLSGLEDIAARTGTSFDTVGDSLVRFNGVLKDARAGSAQAEVFASLNLNVEKLKALDPAEALRQTSIALQGFNDNGDRARIVQELFGRSVRDVAPFLKNLAENGELVAKVTTKQAEEAEKFNRELAALKKNSEDASRALVSDLVTGINAAAKAMRESGLSAGLNTLLFGNDQFRNDKALVEQTENLLRAEKELSASRAKDAQFGDRSARTAAAERRLAAIQQDIRLTQTYRKQLAQEEAAANPSGPAKPNVKPPSSPAGSKQSEAARYLENLQKQLEKTRELSVEEQLLTDLQAKRLGTVPAKLREQLVATAKQVDIARAQAQLDKDNADTAVKIGEQTRQRIDALQRENEASGERNRQLRQSTEELGLTTTALDALRVARLDEAIAHEQSLLISKRDADASAEEIAVIEQRIALKRTERDLTATNQNRSRENSLLAGTATSELERSRDDMLFLTDLFERGRIGETQYLEAVTLRLGITNDKLEKSKSLAEELGMTFNSAFEDAIVGGKSFSKVLQGLQQDIIRLVTRDQVTKPLAKAFSGMFGSGDSGGGIGGIFSGLFSKLFGSFEGGGYTGDGARMGGMDGKGGRLAMLHPKETVIDHSRGQRAGASITVNVNQYFAPGTSRATTLQAAADASRQLQLAARNM